MTSVSDSLSALVRHLYCHFRIAFPNGQGFRHSGLVAFHRRYPHIYYEISMFGHPQVSRYGLVSLVAIAALGANS
ncbi:MAG: hypothetical protein WDM80_12885 [Limisphaerales bacterium]